MNFEPRTLNWYEREGGGLGVYSRTTVPDSVNTGDSHLCNRTTSVPEPSQRTRIQFQISKVDRMFSYELVQRLNDYGNRPWKDLRRGKPIDGRWLARQLSPYGVRPRTLRINGAQAKGYLMEEILEIVQRYVPKPEARALIEELKGPEEGGSGEKAG